ncbi:MAG: DUF3019 domain-containing protein [Gammaproteobacteria bacterium]|nr:DUF3019 domain-containing protein [Gammaproteobacteria bacterium]
MMIRTDAVLFFLLLICCAVSLQAQSNNAPIASLSVKPTLCIVTPQAPYCDTDFHVRWTADRPNEYCLHSDHSEPALQCWQGRLMGEFEENRIISKSFSYWLSQLGFTDRFSQVEVSVLSARSGERRRNRRRRHVWSIL